MNSQLEGETLDEVAKTYQALTGERQKISGQLRDLLQALFEGEENLIVELPWQEMLQGRNHTINQILVHGIEGKRIYFSNPLKRGNEQPGMQIEGEGCGPQRQIHANGIQSMELETFRQLFHQSGQALLPD